MTGQTRSALSPPTVARRALSGEKATEVIEMLCGLSFSSRCDDKSQEFHTRNTLRPPSTPPELTVAKRVPSGEKVTALMLLLCAFVLSSRGVRPETASHTRSAESPPTVAKRVPSGEKVTALTPPK